MNIDRKALFRINQAMMDLSSQKLTHVQFSDAVAEIMDAHLLDVMDMLEGENQALDLWLNEIAKEKAV